MHEDKFARGDKFAREDKIAQRQICTKGQFCTSDKFARRVKFARLSNLHGLGLKIRVKKNRLGLGLKKNFVQHCHSCKSDPPCKSVSVQNCLLVQKCLLVKKCLRANLTPRANLTAEQICLRAILSTRANLSPCKSVFVQFCPLVQFRPFVQFCPLVQFWHRPEYFTYNLNREILEIQLNMFNKYLFYDRRFKERALKFKESGRHAFSGLYFMYTEASIKKITLKYFSKETSSVSTITDVNHNKNEKTKLELQYFCKTLVVCTALRLPNSHKSLIIMIW